MKAAFILATLAGAMLAGCNAHDSLAENGRANLRQTDTRVLATPSPDRDDGGR